MATLTSDLTTDLFTFFQTKSLEIQLTMSL